MNTSSRRLAFVVAALLAFVFVGCASKPSSSAVHKTGSAGEMVLLENR